MTAFVTGAGSELMTQVLNSLRPLGWEFRALSRKKRPDSDGIAWVHGDINDPRTYSNHLAGAEIVIHAAAETHAQKAQSYYEINDKGTGALVKEAKAKGVSKFVFISSRTAECGCGAYGESKLAAEQHVKTYENHLIIRPAEVFGTTKSEGIGSLFNDVLTKSIIAYPAGLKSRLFPVWVNDVARIIAHETNHWPQNKVLTINGPEGFSFPELIMHLATIAKKKPVLVPIPKPLLFALAPVAGIIPMGIVPDQVARLYCAKYDVPNSSNNMTTIGTFLSSQPSFKFANANT